MKTLLIVLISTVGIQLAQAQQPSTVQASTADCSELISQGDVSGFFQCLVEQGR